MQVFTEMGKYALKYEICEYALRQRVTNKRFHVGPRRSLTPCFRFCMEPKLEDLPWTEEIICWYTTISAGISAFIYHSPPTYHDGFGTPDFLRLNDQSKILHGLKRYSLFPSVQLKASQNADV